MIRGEVTRVFHAGIDGRPKRQEELGGNEPCLWLRGIPGPYSLLVPFEQWRGVESRSATIDLAGGTVIPDDSGAPPPAVMSEASDRDDLYWRANLRILGVLLLVWFSVSFGAGILFADALNAFHLPGTGFPLGFWFAQQGAIYTFVVLIFVYVFLMNRVDRRFGVSED